MEKIISKERFVNGFMRNFAGPDEIVNKKFNNDLVFYKMMLDKGIDHFEGGAREGFAITYDLHMELMEQSKVRTLTAQEEQMLDTFLELLNGCSWIFEEADEEDSDE